MTNTMRSTASRTDTGRRGTTRARARSGSVKAEAIARSTHEGRREAEEASRLLSRGAVDRQRCNHEMQIGRRSAGVWMRRQRRVVPGCGDRVAGASSAWREADRRRWAGGETASLTSLRQSPLEKQTGEQRPNPPGGEGDPRGKRVDRVKPPHFAGFQMVGLITPWPTPARASCPGKRWGYPRDSGFPN